MSTLLISAPKSAGGTIVSNAGVSAPDNWSGGIPYTGGKLAIDLDSAITHSHMGLPLTGNGRLAVEIAAADRFGSGAAPFTTTGRIAVTSAAPSTISSGIPYASNGAISMTDVGGGFMDADSAVIGTANCIDKFGGFSAGDMGSTALLGASTDSNVYDGTKGFSPGATSVWGWDGTFFSTTHDLGTTGFTLSFEVESYIFADDWEDGAATDSTLFVGGLANGRGFKHENNGGAGYWDDMINAINKIKTSDVALPEFVRIYYSYLPDALSVGGASGKHQIYLENFLIQEYDDVGDPGAMWLTGFVPTFGYDNIQAYKRNVVLWDKPLDLETNIFQWEINLIGDSFAQWGNFQSGNADNADPTPTADPNNNPPTQYTGPATGSLEFVGKYELKNESLSAQMVGMLAQQNINVTIRNYAAGASTVSTVPVDTFGTGSLIERIDAALGISGSPAGGAKGRCNIWVVNDGTNDENFLFNDASGFFGDPDRPFSDMDAIIPEYQAQLDRMIDDGADRIYAFNIAKRYVPLSGGTEQWPAQTVYLNALYTQHIAGYRGKVTLVDIYSGWSYSLTEGLDPGNDNHPGPAGQRYMAEQLAAAIAANGI